MYMYNYIYIYIYTCIYLHVHDISIFRCWEIYRSKAAKKRCQALGASYMRTAGSHRDDPVLGVENLVVIYYPLMFGISSPLSRLTH